MCTGKVTPPQWDIHMTTETIYNAMLWISFPLAFAVFVTLLFITAPYGRHKRRGWGPSLPNRLGWLFMEFPSVLLFFIWFLIGGVPKNLVAFLFLVMWEAHYLHRAFIYPFRIADGKKKMPVAIMVMGSIFNAGNTFTNGGYLYQFSGGYPLPWLYSPQMLIGLFFFICGFTINRWADRVLRSLRIDAKADYRIPHGGLYGWVSCPNYLGEIITWTGWAIATWSLPGFAFALWTFANLAPRARAHHKWYHNEFPNYPAERKALIPRVW